MDILTLDFPASQEEIYISVKEGVCENKHCYHLHWSNKNLNCSLYVHWEQGKKWKAEALYTRQRLRTQHPHLILPLAKIREWLRIKMKIQTFQKYDLPYPYNSQNQISQRTAPPPIKKKHFKDILRKQHLVCRQPSNSFILISEGYLRYISTLQLSLKTPIHKCLLICVFVDMDIPFTISYFINLLLLRLLEEQGIYSFLGRNQEHNT